MLTVSPLMDNATELSSASACLSCKYRYSTYIQYLSEMVFKFLLFFFFKAGSNQVSYIAFSCCIYLFFIITL